jgi:hypothetical protein
VYTFVDDLETALARAEKRRRQEHQRHGRRRRPPAHERGAIDEISVHVVPVLLGADAVVRRGVDEHVTLEFVGASESPHATHLRYRVVRDG